MIDLDVAVVESRGLIIDHLLEWPTEFLFGPDNEEDFQADHGAGGSLSLSTSPHRRSLEALGFLHNSGGF